MKVLTTIEIDVCFYKKETEDDVERARFECFPRQSPMSGEKDQISISLFKGKEQQYNLTLTPEQCQEFIWALEKMMEIGEEYHKA